MTIFQAVYKTFYIIILFIMYFQAVYNIFYIIIIFIMYFQAVYNIRGSGNEVNSVLIRTAMPSQVHNTQQTAFLKLAIYCPQGSGTLRQQLSSMHGIAWYCMVLHGIAWYCMALHGIV